MDKDDLSKIILGTGSYDNVSYGNTISITGDGGNAWGYYGYSYKKLAPRLITYNSYINNYKKLLELKKDVNQYQQYIELRNQIENDYIKSYYETRLKNLDVIELLLTLKDKFGENIILLCHEEVEEFCHRRIIADYIEIKTGIYIPEVSVSGDGLIKKLTPIRYKDRFKEFLDNF